MTRASKTVLAEFQRFISHQAHFLKHYPELVHQQAFNESSRPHVKAAAQEHLAKGALPHRPWLRKTSGAVRPRHSGEVISLAFWGDERHLAVSTDTREVWVWDIDAAELQLRCDAPPSAARSLVVSPNGKLLAGGFGAPQPNPFVSGVSVWERDGKLHREFRPYEWVYSVRWADDERLIAGAGTPLGADAGGSLWIANLATDECRQVPSFLSERPVVLTWNRSPASPESEDALMALTKNGSVHRVTYDGSITASGGVARPKASTSVDTDTLCIATENEVLEIGLHQRDDRLEISKKVLGRSRIMRMPLIAHPTCLASHPPKRLLAVGTATGEAWIVSLDGNVAPKRLHDSEAPVTAVSFSASGELIAVGDPLGRVFAYRVSDHHLLFHTPAVRELVAGRIDGSRAMMLYPDRLETVHLDDPGQRTSHVLSDSLRPLDFDVCGNLALVLSCSSKTEALTTGSSIQIIDLSQRRVIPPLDVPSGADRSYAAETLMMPCYFERIRLQVGHDMCRVMVGSEQGIIVYPLLGFENGHALVVPSIASDSGLLSPNRPSIWCKGFEINRDRENELVAGYANKVGSPHGAQGDFRVWHIGHREPSCSPRLSSPVISICQSAAGEVIAGTEDGEAWSWRFNGEWQSVAGVAHGAPVVAVCSDGGSVACSTSLDGALIVWDIHSGRALLRTFADLQPIAVGFTPGNRSLCVIDWTGEAHVWNIEEIDAISALSVNGNQQSDNQSGSLVRFDEYFALAESLARVKSQIEQGNYDAASARLRSLPDSPGLASVKDGWLLRIKLAEQRALLPEPVKQELAKLEAISREVTEMWLRLRGGSDLERQLPDCMHVLTEEFRRLIEERSTKRAKALATALPQSPNSVLNVRRSMLEVIRQVEATVELERTAARARELIEEGDVEAARGLVEALPDEPENVLEAKQKMLEQLQEIESGSSEIEQEIETILESLSEIGLSREQIIEMASSAEIDTNSAPQFQGFLRALAERCFTEHARMAIEEVVKSAQELVNNGRIDEARLMFETLPDEPEDILEIKRRLFDQLEELERSRGAAEQEVATILRNLAAVGIGEEKINEIVQENDVDRSNVWQFRALLNALIGQAPPQLRAMLNASDQHDKKPSDARRWRIWKR